MEEMLKTQKRWYWRANSMRRTHLLVEIHNNWTHFYFPSPNIHPSTTNIPSWAVLIQVSNLTCLIWHRPITHKACFGEQLVYLLKSHTVWLARFCMGDDQLAGPCTDDVGFANSVGALWLLGGGAWGSVLLIVVVVCLGVTCFGWGWFCAFYFFSSATVCKAKVLASKEMNNFNVLNIH